MELNQQQLDFIIKFKHRLKERKFLIETFNLVKNRTTITTQEGLIPKLTIPHTDLTTGTIVLVLYKSKEAYYYIDVVESDTSSCVYLHDDTKRSPLHIKDTFKISNSHMENYQGSPSVTSVGRLLINQVVLVEPFGDILPYVNEVWDQGAIEKKLSALLMSDTITIDQFKHFIDAVYLLGHFTELAVPTLTRKAMTTSPEVKKRKQELFKQYEGQLEDPNVIQIIEDELIAMDKAYLKGDDSQGFYDGVGSKAYNIHRKKLFLTVGGIDSFEENSGNYNFIKNSLSEGWDIEDFPTICNEIRKGSYTRGKETAKGGELTAYLARIFQNLHITASDCGTVKGLSVELTSKNIQEFYGRTILGKPSVMITKENASKYINKSVTIKSPMYCKTTDGFCFTCVGEVFRKLDSKALGMLPPTIGSVILLSSMKNMHGSIVTSTKVNYEDFFI